MIETVYPTWPEEFADLYRKEGCWRGETFGKMLRERAESEGERVAVTNGERSLSYSELDYNADCLVSGFQLLGINKGNRVVLQLPNIIEFFEIIFALFRL